MEVYEVKDLFIDGTERRVQRLSDNKKQRLDYSGKRKAHTRKNLIVNDGAVAKQIIFLYNVIKMIKS